MTRRVAIACMLWLCAVTAGLAAQDRSEQSPDAVQPTQSPATSAATPQAPIGPLSAEADTDPSAFEGWTSGRYRLTPSDVLELTFPFVPEFNQVVTVQPDGYITLRGAGELRVQSRTLPELRQQLLEAYAPILHDPSVTITLKEFEKPYFIAAGEVKTPGKFELRGAMTVTQAVALAGGPTLTAKHSQVILFRRYSADLIEVKEINVKRMYATRDLSEDYLLRPGDTIYIPKSLISRLQPFIPAAGFYLNPLNPFGR
jgi:polysaccharide export outer membrane protein